MVRHSRVPAVVLALFWARYPTGRVVTEATLEIEVGGTVARTTARGNGPVHAMDNGLRALIDEFYPSLKHVRLVDYKVRVLSSGDGTGSVRSSTASQSAHRLSTHSPSTGSARGAGVGRSVSRGGRR